MELIPYLSPSDSPAGTVLLAHGFGEHYGRYDEFIQALGEARYDVWTFDFPGHGAGKAGTKDQAIADVGALIVEHLEARRELQTRSRTQSTFLFGHSMGGMITLASTLLSPTGITATAVTGPALRPLPRMPLPIAKVGARIGRLARHIKTVPIDNTKLSHDPSIAEAYANDPLIYQDKVPLLTGATMMVQGAETIANASILAVPVLILHGSADILADVDGSREFVERAGDLAELRIKEGAFHELLHEIDRAVYIQEIIDWYQQW